MVNLSFSEKFDLLPKCYATKDPRKVQESEEVVLFSFCDLKFSNKNS